MISAIAPFNQELCQRILDSLLQMYLKSTMHTLYLDSSNTVDSKTVIICAKLSRVQDDIKATLGRLDIKGN